jgi:dihydroorotate dehydrogenase electron transfer subunit
MLAAVARRAGERGLPVQVALEERMACGFGVCWTCVVPIHGDDGATTMRRSCIDGPVFDGARVDWPGVLGGPSAP